MLKIIWKKNWKKFQETLSSKNRELNRERIKINELTDKYYDLLEEVKPEILPLYNLKFSSRDDIYVKKFVFTLKPISVTHEISKIKLADGFKFMDCDAEYIAELLRDEALKKIKEQIKKYLEISSET